MASDGGRLLRGDELLRHLAVLLGKILGDGIGQDTPMDGLTVGRQGVIDIEGERARIALEALENTLRFAQLAVSEKRGRRP
jgi:hypothetical protein